MNHKIVVACKDFRINPSLNRLDEYHVIKNDYVSELEEKLELIVSSSDFHTISLEEINLILNIHPLFKGKEEYKQRFWDMFIVDALIGNNDRNNGNWGVIVNNNTHESTLAPVYDNGACFSNKLSDEQIQKLMEDETKFDSSVYRSKQCIFTYESKQINPYKFIESMQNNECNEALLRVFPTIKAKEICQMIQAIPNEYNGIPVISDIRKEFYCKCITYRIEKCLQPTYNTLNQA